MPVIVVVEVESEPNRTELDAGTVKVAAAARAGGGRKKNLDALYANNSLWSS